MKDSVKRFLSFISGFVAAGFFTWLFTRGNKPQAQWTRIGKLLFGTVVTLGFIGFIVVVYFLMNGPHMDVQTNLRPYRWPMPTPPLGSVPVHPRPLLSAFAVSNSPLQTAADAQRGHTDYQFYCVFCHGTLGDGNGPVGQSYVPRPTDLRLPQVVELSDAELLRRMLTGIGHAPVLETVIPDSERWYLVSYVRTLPQAGAK